MQENGKSSNDEVVKELIYDGNVKNNNNDKKLQFVEKETWLSSFRK